jgi:CBS domain containing-hemolysin-like protein
LCVFEIKVLIAAFGISILTKKQITSLSPVRLQQMADSNSLLKFPLDENFIVLAFLVASVSISEISANIELRTRVHLNRKGNQFR